MFWGYLGRAESQAFHTLEVEGVSPRSHHSSYYCSRVLQLSRQGKHLLQGTWFSFLELSQSDSQPNPMKGRNHQTWFYLSFFWHIWFNSFHFFTSIFSLFYVVWIFPSCNRKRITPSFIKYAFHLFKICKVWISSL